MIPHYNHSVKLVFLGTPDFAVPSLEKLIQANDIEVVIVITQPDKLVGRKQILTAPPIKTLAEKNKIPVFQPEKINQDSALLEILAKLKPDFLITVAYGQILKQEIMSIAPVINLHASLLPNYRGPAPINWMIIHGDKEIGLTTMLSDAGVDTGDILLKTITALDANEDASKVSERLAIAGADLLLETLRKFSELHPEEQEPAEDPSKQLAPFMDRKLGVIDFAAKEIVLGSANPKQSNFKVVMENSAANIHNLVRALQPWPGANFNYQGQKISILKTKVVDMDSKKSPGTIVEIKKDTKSFVVATQQGLLELITLKPEGKNECDAFSWLNGQRLKIADSLS